MIYNTRKGKVPERKGDDVDDSVCGILRFKNKDNAQIIMGVDGMKDHNL